MERNNTINPKIITESSVRDTNKKQLIKEKLNLLSYRVVNKISWQKKIAIEILVEIINENPSCYFIEKRYALAVLFGKCNISYPEFMLREVFITTTNIVADFCAKKLLESSQLIISKFFKEG